MTASPRQRRWALTAVGLLAAAMIVYSFSHERARLPELAPTLDDTFIHLRFAENLAHGRGFAFNPGEPLPGSTSPLWVLILTPLAAVFSRDHLVTAALALSALSYLAMGLAAFRFAIRAGLRTPFAVLAALLVLANPRLLWAGLSGMETDLFAALSLLACDLYLGDLDANRLRPRTAALFGLATALRPEGYLLFAGVVLHFLLARLAGRREIAAPRPSGLLPSLAVYLALIAPYIIFALVTIHYPLPSTFLAKSAEFGRTRHDYIVFTLRYFWLDHPVAAILLPLAVVRAAVLLFKRRLAYLASPAALAAGWGLGYLAVSAALTPMPFHFCRYQLPVLPFLLVFLTEAVQAAADWSGRCRPRVATAIAAAVLALPALINLPHGPANATICAKNILEMHMTVGRMLARMSAPGDTIATMDIGAIGYYSDRKIVDLVGLVTPEVVPYVRGKGFTPERSASLLQYLRRVRPDFIAVFPAAYPGLLDAPGLCTPLARVQLPDNLIAEADLMLVCRCNWSDYRPAP
jgi:arabinofuranosyltransferase